MRCRFIHRLVLLIVSLKIATNRASALGFPTKESSSLPGVNDTQKEYTVYVNTSITIVVDRISRDFQQVLKKDGRRIMGIDSEKNKTTYTIYSDAEMKVNRAHYSMKTLNENQIAVVIHGWTSSVAGNYTVYHDYRGANPAKDPHSTIFRVQFAERPSTDATPTSMGTSSTHSQTLASRTQDLVVDTASTTITTAPTTTAFSRTTQNKTIHPSILGNQTTTAVPSYKMDDKSDDGPDVSTIAKIASPCVLGVVIIIVCIALYVRGRRGRRGSYTVGPCDEKLQLGDVKGA